MLCTRLSPVDTVVVAVGTMANPIVPATPPEFETNKWGYIVVKDESGLTSSEGGYVVGDIVSRNNMEVHRLRVVTCNFVEGGFSDDRCQGSIL